MILKPLSRLYIPYASMLIYLNQNYDEIRTTIYLERWDWSSVIKLIKIVLLPYIDL